MGNAPRKSIGTVPDDRGEPRPVIAVTELFSDPRMNDPAFAAVGERVLRLKSSGMRIGRTVVVAVVVALALAGVSIVLRNFANLRLPPWVMPVATSTCLIIFTTWYLRRFEKKNAPEVARILLADGVCPSCAYTLADIPEDADGCAVCPECGGAWNGQRIIRRARYREHQKDRPSVRGLAVLWQSGVGTGAVRIKDDAGTERPLASPRLKREIAAASGERRERLIAAARANLASGRIVRWGIGGVYLFAGFGVFAFVHRIATFKGAWVAAAAVGLLISAFSLLFIRGSAGVTAPWMRKRMLAHGLCPSCAADLPEAEAEADPPEAPEPRHTRKCAHCNAQWTREPADS